jgi:hypothetical protein
MAEMAAQLTLEERLIAAFPKLAETNFAVTSQPTTDYNCIAWAAGFQDHWWWPGRHWPAEIPAVETRLAFIKAFRTLGYEECETPDLEAGYEKVCFYEKMGKPTHAARQLANGLWTSKLGLSHDISHELEGLRGNRYGKPAVYMRRPIPNDN